MRVYRVRGKPDEKLISLIKEGKIILVNADNILSRKIVESAYLKAKRSFLTGTNISRDMETEVMLYLSGNRQVSHAIAKFGAGDYGDYYIIADDKFIPKEFGFVEINENEEIPLESILKDLEKVAIFEIKK